MKKIVILMMFLILLTACSQDVTPEYLIGGKWEATAGYENGEVTGEPTCDPVKSIRFLDSETVYVEYHDEDFEYFLSDRENSKDIMFEKGNFLYQFHIEVIDEDEMGFIGLYGIEGRNCYLERQTEKNK